MTARIALSGFKGSGKSTFSDHLVTKGYHELAFAEPLKQMVINLFGIDPKWVYNAEYKETVIPELGVSGRDLCQVIGTELFRDALMKHLPTLKLRGGSIWTHALLSELDRQSGDVVVSDCRFNNEYDVLHNNGFTVLKIERTTQSSNHPSEQGCPCDDVIINTGSIDDLYREGNLKIEKRSPITLSSS